MTSNVLQLKPQTRPTAQPTRYTYHDGALVLYKRENSKKGAWWYALKLPNSKELERKTTKTGNFDEAVRIAEERYQETKTSTAKVTVPKTNCSPKLPQLGSPTKRFSLTCW